MKGQNAPLTPCAIARRYRCTRAREIQVYIPNERVFAIKKSYKWTHIITYAGECVCV